MAEILLLGQDRDRSSGVRSLLRQDGHAVTWERDVNRWTHRERDLLPDVVVAALPTLDPLLGAPGRVIRGFPPPILLVQDASDPDRESYLEDRLVDRLRSPFSAEDLLGHVDALVRLRRTVLRRKKAEESAVSPADTDEAAAEPRWDRLGRRLMGVLGMKVPRPAKPKAPYMDVVSRAADWADRRDAFEPGHAERVTSYAAMVADMLGIPNHEAAALLRAGMLHDIGKVALPLEVLKRPGPLSDEQMRLVRTHAQKGADLVYALDPDREVAQMIRYHHEKVDGSGYHGRRGDQIPLGARVLAVAEAYDAMTTSRFREPLSRDRALDELRERKGSQFDPDCVEALEACLRPRPKTIPLSVA